MSTRPAIPLQIPSTLTDSPFVDEKGLLSEHVKKFLIGLNGVQSGAIQVRFTNTHAERLKRRASLFAEGTTWKESDTGLIYVSDGENWEPQSGQMSVEFEALPMTLGAGDAGLEVFVSDYNHVLRWNGTGWEFLPGDHSGYTQTFLLDPGIGWLQCDGSTGVATLLSDGTVDFSVDLPNTPGLWYRQ